MGKVIEVKGCSDCALAYNYGYEKVKYSCLMGLYNNIISDYVVTGLGSRPEWCPMDKQDVVVTFRRQK